MQKIVFFCKIFVQDKWNIRCKLSMAMSSMKGTKLHEKIANGKRCAICVAKWSRYR